MTPLRPTLVGSSASKGFKTDPCADQYLRKLPPPIWKLANYEYCYSKFSQPIPHPIGMITAPNKSPGSGAAAVKSEDAPPIIKGRTRHSLRISEKAFERRLFVPCPSILVDLTTSADDSMVVNLTGESPAAGTSHKLFDLTTTPDEVVDLTDSDDDTTKRTEEEETSSKEARGLSFHSKIFQNSVTSLPSIHPILITVM
jgi:hypothetical protein